MLLSLRCPISGVLFALFILAASAWGQSSSPAMVRPPSAQVQSVIDDYFGSKFADPYRWMEAGPSDPKFLEFLKAQNDYTHSVLAPLSTARDKLLARLKELDNAVPAVGFPTRAGEYIFFLQTNPGARTGSLMVRGPEASIRTLLDPGSRKVCGKECSRGN